ncbi:MAG: hypothetical protein WCJ33_04200 [Pseudomonadota bacterium]
MSLKMLCSILNPLICYAAKANDTLAVIKTLVKEGSGVSIWGRDTFCAQSWSFTPKNRFLGSWKNSRRDFIRTYCPVKNVIITS